MSSFVFLKPPSLPTEIRRVLEEEIIFGALEPGRRLTETELAERYQVSRAALREALVQLEQDQLVTRQPRRGLWVAPISRQDLNDIYSCRIPLESMAAEQAALLRKDEDLARFRDIHEDMTLAFQRSDVRGYFHANVALTSSIRSICRNHVLCRLLDSIGKPALRYRHMVYSKLPHLLSASLKGNGAIIEALTAQDAPAARALTEDLIRSSWKAMDELLAGEDSAPLLDPLSDQATRTA